jgi:hypothetical protein
MLDANRRRWLGAALLGLAGLLALGCGPTGTTGSRPGTTPTSAPRDGKQAKPPVDDRGP